MKTVTVNNAKLTTTREIGRHGEELVASVLPGSRDINVDGEVRLPYDVLWNGIKIDVKFCAKNSDNGSFTWNLNTQSSSKGIILVYTAFHNGTYLFWVERYCRWGNVTKNARDALLAHELEQAILDVYDLPDPTKEALYDPMTVKIDYWDSDKLDRLCRRYSIMYQTLIYNDDAIRLLINEQD